MKIKIVIIDDPDMTFGEDSVRVRSLLPFVECNVYGSSVAEGVEHVKGTCLCAVGLYEKVPNEVSFDVKDERKATERRSKFSNCSPGIGNRKTDV